MVNISLHILVAKYAKNRQPKKYDILKNKKQVGNNMKISKMDFASLCSHTIFHEFFAQTLPDFSFLDILKCPFSKNSKNFLRKSA